MTRHLNVPSAHKIALRGLIAGRPTEAAEVMAEFGYWPKDETLGGTHDAVGLEECKVFTGLVLRGTTFYMHVRTQKALNALAGYFWVEPRRLP